MNRSSCGLKENLAAGFFALMGGSPILFVLFLEKDSYLVRFHTVQAILLMLVVAVVGPITCGIGSVLGTIFWIIQIIKAFKGEMYEAPIVGKWAHKILE